MHPVAVFILITLGIAFLTIILAVNYGIGKMNKEYDKNCREHFFPYNLYPEEYEEERK